MVLPASARRPRVVHVVQTLVAGGAETAVRILCRGLAAEGVDAGVVSVYPSGLDDAGRAELGVPIVDLRRRGRGDLSYFAPLVRALRTLRPDVVHAHVHTGQYPGRVAALVASAPAIAFTVHGDEPGGALRWALDRVLHARTARFIVFTQAQRARFAAQERVPLERIAVIPNGVAAQQPRGTREAVRAMLGLPQTALLAYSAARLAPEKNQRAALGALARARAAGIDVDLALAGTGPLETELRGAARSLGIGEHVHFLGLREDSASLAFAMDLFVLPSLNERMPLALGEAMLAGLAPVIAPWVGHEELIRDGITGFVAPGFDDAAFAEALIRALCDEGARSAVAARAKAAAQRVFDAGAMVRAHADLYRELSGVVTS